MSGFVIRPQVGDQSIAMSMSVCPSTSISQQTRIQTSNFLRMLPVPLLKPLPKFINSSLPFFKFYLNLSYSAEKEADKLVGSCIFPAKSDVADMQFCITLSLIHI